MEHEVSETTSAQKDSHQTPPGSSASSDSQDALLEQINKTVRERTQYKVQFRKQQQGLKETERHQKAFDKAQQKASPVESTALPLQSVVPGDQFTLEGEEVIVRDVQSDEDGNVLSVQIEDGKKFGVLNLDAQSRGAILVDEFTPRTRDTGGGTRPPLAPCG